MPNSLSIFFAYSNYDHPTGVQNADHLQTLDDDYFKGLGLRVAPPTCNTRNLISGAAVRRDDGLSDYGVTVVERINKAGGRR